MNASTHKESDIKIVRFLTHLAHVQTNDGWVYSKTLSLDEFPYFIRQQAQRLGYVEARGNTAHRQFKLTAKDFAVVGETPVGVQPVTKPQFNSVELSALQAMKERLEAKRELKLKALIAKMVKETVEELVEKALDERLGSRTPDQESLSR